MKSNSDSGVVTLLGRRSVDQTVSKLEESLRLRGVKLFAVINHSGEAHQAGLYMRPTKLLIFGNATAGTPLMVVAPTSALDLPLKILVWKDEAGQRPDLLQPTLIPSGAPRLAREPGAKDLHSGIVSRSGGGRGLKMQQDETLTTGLGSEATTVLSQDLRVLLADVFTLYIKTKNFHWHMRGPHFRDYHLLLDEQASELFTITDEIAERARKLGGTTIRSIAEIERHQRLKDSERDDLSANDMMQDLCSDNQQLAGFLRATHQLCEHHRDVATASLIETWIDQAERRVWFLSESLAK